MRIKKHLLFLLLALMLSGCANIGDSFSENETHPAKQSAETVPEEKTKPIETRPPKYCIYEGCTEEVSQYRTVCREHRCVTCLEYKDLDSVQLPGSKYCDYHTCLVVDCKEPTYGGYNYCISHSRKLNEELMDIRHNRCASFLCYEEPQADSNFCKEHTCTEYNCRNGAEVGFSKCGEHIWWEEDRSRFLCGRNIKGKKLYEPSKSSNHSTHREYDPDDYDSPEDFADDAWGRDFDDWDDAYDYWENY